jgi:hypothetical protein
MTHPTPTQIREWMERLENGQAYPGMLKRVVAGYEALYRIARAAEYEHQYCGHHETRCKLCDAREAFGELEPEPEQMTLEPER